MSNDNCSDIRAINKTNADRLEQAKGLLQEIVEAWEYFSEYDVPIGMREDIEKFLMEN